MAQMYMYICPRIYVHVDVTDGTDVHVQLPPHLCTFTPAPAYIYPGGATCTWRSWWVVGYFGDLLVGVAQHQALRVLLSARGSTSMLADAHNAPARTLAHARTHNAPAQTQAHTHART
jgi:hypothetical protein